MQAHMLRTMLRTNLLAAVDVIVGTSAVDLLPRAQY